MTGPGGERPAGERGERPARPRPGPPEPPKPKAKRLQPGRAYRDAVLAELSPERKAVAEQILRGGIPAVRQAVEEQNAQAREVGGPEIKADALLAVAEELLPALRAAEWRDRAEAAVVIVDEISVRDLRAVVSGADTARDEEGRALAAQLREALDRRAAAERQSWVDEITSSLDDGRVVRALRISGRPPEPGVRFPAELAKRLSDAGGEALAPETTPDRWAAVLEAVVASPVRRTITPKGLPAEPGEALTKALRLAAPRVPAIAALLGDPRGPRPAARPARLPRRSRPRRARPPRPVPPRPPGPRARRPRPPRRPAHPAPRPPRPHPAARRARAPRPTATGADGPRRAEPAATEAAAPRPTRHAGRSERRRAAACPSAAGDRGPCPRPPAPRPRGRARPRHVAATGRHAPRAGRIRPLAENRRPSRWTHAPTAEAPGPDPDPPTDADPPSSRPNRGRARARPGRRSPTDGVSDRAARRPPRGDAVAAGDTLASRPSRRRGGPSPRSAPKRFGPVKYRDPA